MKVQSNIAEFAETVKKDFALWQCGCGDAVGQLMIDGVNNTIACGTQVQTDEKQLNAVVDTKDMGSQIFKDVREASCGAASVRTESVGS